MAAVDEFFSKVENQRFQAQKLRNQLADQKHLAKVGLVDTFFMFFVFHAT